MPTFLPYVTSVCYRDGLDIGGYIAWFFYNLPITVWYLLAGVAFYSSDVYIQLLSSSYWLNLAVVVLIAESAQSPRPHPACNNQGYGLPAWESSLAYHYIVMMLCHRWMNWRRLSLFDLFRGVLIGVIVPLALGLSGNYSAWQIFAGILVGIGVGGYVMISVATFWMDRLAFITKDAPILNHWGFKNGAQSFYTDKQVALQNHQDTAEAETTPQASSPTDDSDISTQQEPLMLVKASLAEDIVLGDPFANKGSSSRNFVTPVIYGNARLPIVSAASKDTPGHFRV